MWQLQRIAICTFQLTDACLFRFRTYTWIALGPHCFWSLDSQLDEKDYLNEDWLTQENKLQAKKNIFFSEKENI